MRSPSVFYPAPAPGTGSPLKVSGSGRTTTPPSPHMKSHTFITSVSAATDTRAPSSSSGRLRMSLCRPLDQSTILESCSFSASTITTNWVRTSFGQLFVRRLVTFSTRSILRTDIRPKVVELLDNREIQHTSVDLARFRWDEQNTDGGRETVTS